MACARWLWPGRAAGDGSVNGAFRQPGTPRYYGPSSDAQIYTNDKAHLTESLGRDVSHRSAMEQSQIREAPAQNIETSIAVRQPAQQIGMGR